MQRSQKMWIKYMTFLEDINQQTEPRRKRKQKQSNYQR